MEKNECSQIEDFLKDNYPLFAIMGVFGALSIYLTNLDNDDLFFQIGIVASFTIFILISILILWKARGKLIRMDTPDVSWDSIIENSKMVLFIFPFYMLVITIAYYVINSLFKPFEILLGLFMFIFGALLAFGILSIVDNKVKNAVLYILIGPALFIGISYFGFYFIQIHDFIPQLFFASTGVVSAAYLITKLIDLILSLIRSVQEKNERP